MPHIAKTARKKAQKLIHKIDSAGHIMTDKVPKADTNQTVSETRSLIYDNIKEYKTINYIYVLSKQRKLKGIVSIKELFYAPANLTLSQIMTAEIVKAHPDTDREKVAHLALIHNLKAIPVVNKKDVFLGAVPSDEILHTLDEETKEDLLRLTGFVGREHFKNFEKASSFRLYLTRIPWILVGLVGGLIAAQVIGSFEHVLSKNIVLAGFIPLVAYVANAVGIQTQTVYIRDLVTLVKFNFAHYALKQFLISIFIGLSCWLLIAILTLLLWNTFYIGFIVGLSVFSAILIATLFALLIPYTLSNLKLDPAIGSGPFSTIIQDLLSIVIYFLIAEALV